MQKQRSRSLPDFRSFDSLRALYKELSAKRTPYYKTIVLVRLRQGQYLTSIVHTDPNHLGLTKKGYRNAVDVIPVRHFTEYTEGSLYAPSSTDKFGQMNIEWALIFKIDCDLARAKTGNIDNAIAHYMSEYLSTSDTQEGSKIRKLRDILTERKYRKPAKPRGRPPIKSNSKDMLNRYGNDNEAKSWILKNANKLDNAKNFKHDDYRDPVLHNTQELGFDL